MVPKENLLVWNVKDGWEPVCRFLGKDIPKQPFPIINKVGFETGIFAVDSSVKKF